MADALVLLALGFATAEAAPAPSGASESSFLVPVERRVELRVARVDVASVASLSSARFR